MNAQTAALPLHLLGGVVRLADQAVKLERKGAGLLAYLAVEGITPRSVLAGLLWPNADESAARTNLRQIIHRLRRVGGHHLLLGDEFVGLASQVQTDLATLELAAFGGQHAQVLNLWGELLGGFDFDDCPAFAEWLLARRARLLQMRLDALEALSETAQGRGNLRAALRYAQELRDLEPLSEVSHRRVMRLHYLLGDRAAAQQAFSVCQAVLSRELGVKPMPQTLALAREIQEYEALSEGVLSEDAPAPPGALPLTVQRPPQLVGRAAAWEALELAWNVGQTVFLAGPGGIGKSRLAEDFLGSKGRYHLFEGQEGDAAIPYAALLRAYRRLLHTCPQLQPEGWVRTELARLLPELGTPTAGAVSDQEKLRFLEAQAFFIAQILESGSSRLLIENLHFQDQASVEVWAYVLRHPAVRECGAFAVFTYRPEDCNAWVNERIQEALRSGQATLIDLQPWTAEDVQAVIHDLGLPVAPGLAVALGRYAGGNPLFLLETLRSLIESGELERADPLRLPLPERLERLVARRLERLSREASRLASVLAVAGQDFSLNLAAAVLEIGVLDLNAPWQELGRSQVITAGEFGHDLLRQAVLAQLAAPIRQVLHGRVAAYLEGQVVAGGGAARVAHHWQEAGEGARAAPWWVRAGEQFLNQGASVQASRTFTKALEAGGTDWGVRRAALRGLGSALLGQNLDEAQGPLRTLHGEALARRDSRALVEAGTLLAEWHLKRGELAQGVGVSEEAARHLRSGWDAEITPENQPATPEDQLLGAELWRGRYWLELRSGRLDGAQEAIQTALTFMPGRAALINELALLLWHAGQFEAAAAQFELLRARLQADDQPQEPWLAGNQAWTLWALGRNAEAATLLEEALASPGAPFDRGLQLSNLSVILTSQGQYRRALEVLDEARPLLRGYQLNMTDADYRVGVVHYRAGQYAGAREWYARALGLARVVGDPYRLTYVLASHAANEALLGHLREASAACGEALALAASIRFPLATLIAEQAGALVARLEGQPQTSLKHAQQALLLARQCGIPEQVGYSQLLIAQVPGGGHSALKEALEEALALGERLALPDLAWQAARDLGLTDRAARARAILREQAPAGWLVS